MLPRDEDNQSWLSVGLLFSLIWNFAFTRLGVLVTFLVTIFVTLMYYNDKGIVIFALAPFLTIFFYAILIALAFLVFVSEIFADWAIDKIFKKPDRMSLMHNVVYFLLSSFGFILALALFGG